MTTETNAPALKPGTPEYDAAMIAKAEGRVAVAADGQIVQPAETPKPAETPAAPETKPQKPEWLEDKFWDAEKGEIRTEALAKSYRELQTTQSQKKPISDPTKPQGDQQGDQSGDPAQTPTFESVMAKATEEYTSGGKFSDETYASLEKLGITRQYADSYVEGLQARAELTKTRIYGAAGGETEYASMLQWATANLSPAQIDAYNAAMDSGKLDTIVGAVQNLKALYTGANGTPAQTRVQPQGGAQNAPAPEAFRSSAEMVAAMKDPRYKTDAAYRADVERKVAGAAALGINLMI